MKVIATAKQDVELESIGFEWSWTWKAGIKITGTVDDDFFNFHVGGRPCRVPLVTVTITKK